ncbi:MAG TPA: L,D-transpeptidase family protein [Candidatus Dormibacteraeota bacterium]|nr:L,D-transpeptidase family protein [Candidatus Dormibacteraeota bacterium]
MPTRIVAVGIALAVLLTMAGFAVQTDRAFEARSSAVAVALDRLRRDGVDPAAVDALARRLQAIREEHRGPVPASWLPAPVGTQTDRLHALLGATREAESAALASGRLEVERALSQLADSDPGLPATELAAYRARSDAARTPDALRRLTGDVQTAATTAAQQRRPALDLGPEVAQLRQLTARAADLRIDFAQASAAIVAYDALLKVPASQVGAELPSVSNLVRQAGESLAVAIERTERERAAPIPPPAPGQRGRVVVVDLSDEYLYAYQDGSVLLTTPVTTGRPELRTDQGTFHVMSKSSPYLFISPWPKSSPFYYPPTWVTRAVKFIGNGTYLHDAPWQPDGTYGAGSQNGPYASHGCVHVPSAAMATLYGWLREGDLVIVQP